MPSSSGTLANEAWALALQAARFEALPIIKSLAFSEEDVSALLAAGWVWQDLLAEDDGIVRTLQRVRGVVLSADYSRVLTRLLNLEKRWVVPSTDDRCRDTG